MARNLIAILRGISPPESVDIAKALVNAGIDMIEVPMNSPSPFASIEAIIRAVGSKAKIGAGTVLTAGEVQRLAEVGARMIVSPNCNIEVIKATKSAGMESYPGVLTPTDCFLALDAGADGLKFFPANVIGIDGFSALTAVLPGDRPFFIVGGVGPENFSIWKDAGAHGFGIGSRIYRPGKTASSVHRDALEMVERYDACFPAPC